VSSIVASVAMIVTLFLKDIPLKAPKTKPGEKLTAAGDELAVQLGNAQAKDEPILSISNHRQGQEIWISDIESPAR